MPPLSDYSAADLASLAPEERSALEAADSTNKDDLEALAAGGEEGGEAAAPAAPAAAPAQAPAAGPAAAPAAAATAPAATPAAPAAAPVATAPAAAPAAGPSPAPGPSTVVYRTEVGDVSKLIATEKETIKAARGEKRTALMQLNDGEIDADAYAKIEDAAEAKIDAANDKILELNRAQTRNEVAVELTGQQLQNTWKTMLNDYVAKAKVDGIDYQADEGKRGEFNSLVKAFAQEASDKGMSDDDGMKASKWALDQASAVMSFRYPKAAAAPAAGAPAAAPGAAPAAAPGAPVAAAAPALGGLQTLAKMPAAAAAPVADDVMAKINTLEGEELELYMASLPRDVYARVTAGAQ